MRASTIERLDYTDAAGVPKRALVAHRGPMGGIALSGHMDTVPDTGWQEDPWSARLDDDGILHGLGSTDMKGPVAAAIVAARSLPASVPITLLITTDEETTKQGARLIAQTLCDWFAGSSRVASSSLSPPAWCRCAAIAATSPSPASPPACRRTAALAVAATPTGT